jgi:hypothetical protein
MSTLCIVFTMCILATPGRLSAATTNLPPKKLEQTAYNDLAKRCEWLWSRVVTPQIQQAPAEVRSHKPNVASFMFSWIGQPQFPQAYQLAKHQKEGAAFITYALRDSQTNVWAVTNLRGTWVVYRGSVSKEGEYNFGFNNPVSAKSLQNILTYFTPHLDNTSVLMSPVMERSDSELIIQRPR